MQEEMGRQQEKFRKAATKADADARKKVFRTTGHGS
jgi:hypothetical protein